MDCSKTFTINVEEGGDFWDDLVWVDNGSYNVATSTESHAAAGDSFVFSVTSTDPIGNSQAAMQGTLTYADAAPVNCNLHVERTAFFYTGGGGINATITVFEDTGGGPVLILLVSSSDWDPDTEPTKDFPFTISGAAAIQVNAQANAVSSFLFPGTNIFDYNGLLTVIP